MKGTIAVVRRVARNTFWDAYDHMGMLVLTNALWVLLSIPVVTIPWATAGLLRVTYEMVTSRKATLSDFVVGARKFGGHVALVLLLALGWCALAALNVVFYLRLGRESPFLGTLFACLCAWITLAVMLVFEFLLPCLVELKSADDPARIERISWMPRRPIHHARTLFGREVAQSLSSAFRVSVVLTICAPMAALLTLGCIGYVWCFAVVSGVGLVLFGASISALALHHLYGEVVAELCGLGDRRADERRTVRELLRPWAND